MTTLFISQLDPRNSISNSSYFEIVIEKFINAMNENWQTKLSRYDKRDKFVLEWEIENQKLTNMQGQLHSDLLTVSFSYGPIDDVTDFIVWYRSYIPKSCPLYLFDEGLNLVIQLKDQLSREFVIELIS